MIRRREILIATFCALSLGTCGVDCCNIKRLQAAKPARHFPWGCHAASAPIPVTPKAGYQTLPRQPNANARPIENLPAKQPYAYGWFGSQPHPQWSRHFGQSRSFTQWSRK